MGGTIELITLPLSVTLSFFARVSFISSLFGVEFFYLALSSLPKRFFIKDDSLMASTLLVYTFNVDVSFSECLICAWYLPFSLSMD